MAELAIGIDLGTTNSLVAVLEGGKPRVLENALGERLTPSVVAVDGSGTLLVGASAKERISHDPNSGVAFFKRAMGEGTRFPVGTSQLTAVELSGLILRHLKEAAEAQLGTPVHSAVISVPAYFQEPQRSATREAAALAGLNLLRLINEPTAAAIAHGIVDTERERTCVVLDLGGGTFDVTVLEIFHGVVEIIASGGDSRLGGEDFTDALTEWAEGRGRGADSGLPLSSAQRAMLRRRVDRAKCELSDADTAQLDVPRGGAPGWEGAAAVELTRTTLEAHCAPLIERVRRCIEDTLLQAKLAPSAINEVVLVGGATRMPWMQQLALTLFGHPPTLGHDPDLAVAQGAAVQAALALRDESVRDLVVTDVTPHSLGVEISRDAGDRMLGGYFLPVLHRNTTLPTRRVTRVSTVHPKQTKVKIRVYQGDRRFVAQNRFLGEFEITEIPPLEGEEGGQALDLAITCDVSGLVEVEAKVVATGKTAAIVIEQHPGRLSPAERAQSMMTLQRLKTHPRDLLPNRHLLERARAAFEYLDQHRRDRLDPYLFAFESALDHQDAEAVKESGSTLRRVLNELGARHA